METEISETVLQEWKKQAEKDDLLDEYEYHIGMIYPPLPYRRWKMKYDMLNRIQSTAGYYDDRLSPATYKLENTLCNELGY